jgi:mycothiol synthase
VGEPAQSTLLLDSGSKTDAELGEVYALLRRCKLAAAPDDPYYTVDELIAMDRRRPGRSTDWVWVADGGLAILVHAPGDTHANMELVVAPEARRRGLGRHLASVAFDQARALGCGQVIGRYADRTGAAFARELGGREGNSALTSTVVLSAAVVEPEPVPGYAVRSWVDEPPEELFESWIETMNAIHDAPRTAGIDHARITGPNVRDMLATFSARGRQTRITVALDGGGDVVGSTELRVGARPGAVARTAGTSVIAAHRRRGLARWIKAESLARLRSDRPDVPIVHTSNDVANTGMLAVNRAAGFQAVATYTYAIFDL